MTRFARFLPAGIALAVVASGMPTPSVAGAQVIRGTVTDRASAPAVGAVVTLVRPAQNDTLAGTDIRSVLVDATGAFSVGTPGPGRYRIVVRRIGWRPFRSELLDVGAGATVRVDAQLEALSQSTMLSALPEIRITRATPCRTDASDATRIANLWNDARTALLASEVSRSNGSVPTLLIRFVRTLDALTLAVLTETLQLFDQHDVGNARGFRSLSGDSLSAVGYWHRVSTTSTTFHGPDANALLSEAFVRDHCFNLVDATTESPGAVALFFEPVRARTRPGMPPEIAGSIWFDATSSKLQRVEFNWTSLPGDAPVQSLGGVLTFGWNASGAVHVDRWHLRMPQDVLELQGSYDNVTRVRRVRIVEEGGVVFADSSAVSAGSADVHGDLRVGRRPLAGAQVRVLGTSLATLTDNMGRFAFRGVPAGLRVLVADHPTTATYGMRSAVLRVLLDAGENREVSLIAPDQEEMAKNLCGPNAWSNRNALLRVTAVDSLTAQPVADIRVRLLSRGGTPPIEIELETDASGAAVFCELPPNRPLIVLGPGGAILLSEFTLSRNQLASRQLWVAR